MVKLVNHRQFHIHEENLQKHGLAGQIISVESYYMVNPSFQSQFFGVTIG